MAITKAKLIADGVITVDNLHESHGITTTHIGEGNKLFYTDTRVSNYLSANNYITTGDVPNLETVTSLSISANILSYTNEAGITTNIDLSTYLDDTNLARLVSGTLNPGTGIATFTRDDLSTFTIDFSAFLADANDYVSSGSFNTSTGVLTLTRLGGGTVTVDLDGKYAEASHTHLWSHITDRPTALSAFTNDLGNYGGFVEIESDPTVPYHVKIISISDVANWNSAYGWGNHAGLYLGVGAKAADSELIDGIDSTRIIYGDNSTGTSYISGATLDTALKSGFYTTNGGVPNATAVNFVLHTAYYGEGNLAGFDLACNDSTSSSFYLRPATGGGKGAWQTIITSSNVGSQSVNYATSAGTAIDLNAADSTQINFNNITNTDYSTMTFMSRAWQDVQGVNGLAYTFNTHTNAGSGGYGALQIYYGESGYVYAPTSFRAPIFYDSNNTGYYLDPASTSRINAVQFDNIGVGQSVNGSYRIITSGDIYLNANGNGWAEGTWKQRRAGSTWYDVIDSGNIGSQSVSYATSAGNSDTVDGLHASSFLRYTGWVSDPGQDANTQGQMKSDFTYANNAPFTGELIRFSAGGYSLQLNASYQSSDGLAFRTYNADSAQTWNPWKTIIHSGNIGSQSVNYATGSGNSTTTSQRSFNYLYATDYLETSGAVYGTVFYDNNDRGYYLNPQGFSNLGRIKFNDVVSSGAPVGDAVVGRNYAYNTLELKGYGAEMMIGSQSTDLHINYRYCNNTGNNSYTPQYWYWRNGTSSGWSDHYWGIGYGAYSLRSPIFYDSNNTGYYLDPHATSNLNTVQVSTIRNNGSVADDDGFGIYWTDNADSSYGIYRESGGWSHPYPDLRIAFHTGIKLGANSSYNGIRFYTDYDMGTQVMSVNNSSDGVGGGHVYVNNTLQAGEGLRAPTFYDSNDTNYYINPNNTSNLAGLTVGSQITGSVSGYATYAKRIADPERINFTVGGNSSTFYPISIYTGAGSTTNQYAEFVIERGGYDDPGYSGIGFSTFNARFTYKPSGWGYGAVYFNLEQLTQTATCLADYVDYYQASEAIIWLRGGTTYWIYSIVGGITINFSNPDGTSYSPTYNTFSPTTSINTKASYARYFHSSSYTDGTLRSGTDVQAPIFYDINDTGYYIDPNSTGTCFRGNGGVYVNGDVTAYYSDMRLKTKIADIENPIEKVKSLSGFIYEPNEIAQSYGYKKEQKVGVSAQEVQAVLPEAVKDAPIGNGYLTVQYDKLVPLLIEAIKEQQKEIEELKAIVNGITK